MASVEAACVSVKAVASINENLAEFYQSHLQKMQSATSGSKKGDTEIKVVVGNTATRVETGDGGALYDWDVYVDPQTREHAALIRSVDFQLHPTFTPTTVRVSEPPFRLQRRGWGTFDIQVRIVDVNGGAHKFSHTLSFGTGGAQTTHTLVVGRSGEARVPAGRATPAHGGGTSVDGAGAGAGAGAAGSGSGAGSARIAPMSAAGARRMTGVPPATMHGSLHKPAWRAPLLVTYCDTEARPGYNTMKAHEYQDDPETLAGKVKVLADLVRRSRHCVAYTGAGISTASGINDYASKSKDSVATGSRSGRKKKGTGLSAEPTFAHYALTALFNEGHLKHWVQQNHDGLPQKAGFPQQHLNEIHGAWFDPSNPVVPMTGTLRTDLCEWMEQEEEAADLVLAMGTSLCGMNADRMVSTPSRKAARGKALGSVIIGLQRTQMDEGCSLRFFCKIDEVMLLLALELGLRVPTTRYRLRVSNEHIVAGEPHTYWVPYDKKGKLVSGDSPKRRKWCLAPGTKVRVTAGPGKGFRGTMQRASNGKTAFTVATPCQREGSKDHGKGSRLYSLGVWWVEAACTGRVPMLPLVNA